MQSKWLDVGMEMSAFHLQSEKYDSIRPPHLDREEKEISVLKRKRISAMSQSQLQEALNQVSEEDSGDIGGTRRKFMNTQRNGKKSFRLAENQKLGEESDSEKLESSARSTPSFFLQEATHLISLLSAVAFSTLRSDIEGVETPLKAFHQGDPWPPVDPDSMDTKSSDVDESVMKIMPWLLGKSRNPAQRTM